MHEENPLSHDFSVSDTAAYTYKCISIVYLLYLTRCVSKASTSYRHKLMYTQFLTRESFASIHRAVRVRTPHKVCTIYVQQATIFHYILLCVYMRPFSTHAQCGLELFSFARPCIRCLHRHVCGILGTVAATTTPKTQTAPTFKQLLSAYRAVQSTGVPNLKQKKFFPYIFLHHFSLLLFLLPSVFFLLLYLLFYISLV